MSTTDYSQSLNPREQEIVDYLADSPSTYKGLAEQFGFSQSTARDHVSAIEQSGAPLSKRRIDGGKVEAYMRDAEGEHPTNQNETRKYGARGKKSEITKRANKHLQRLSTDLDEVLNDTRPPVSEVPLSTGGEEDVVIHVTDDHIGDKLDDEFGKPVFNTEIAIQRIAHRVNNTFAYIDRQEAAGYDFHTAHYVMGGDIVTGSGIYKGQAWELEMNINEQIHVAVREHFAQIRRLSDRFEAVQVVCQTGNHGEIRVSGSSQKANADDVVYRMLDLIVRVSDLDNVTLVRNHSMNFTNFEVRGHGAQVRHGKHAKPQSQTRAAADDFKSWILMHEKPALMYLGHFHIQGHERVMETQLIRSGSIKPGDDFEESISKWSMPAATIHGVSDSRPVTWKFDVEFEPSPSS